MAAAVAMLPLWDLRSERGGVLSRAFVFHDFAQAMAFMTQAAFHARLCDHHPEWLNVCNRVCVTLTTHDIGGISPRSVALAQVMDRIAATLDGQAQGAIRP